MGFIQLDSIGVSFGDRRILSEINLTISPKTRMALSGANGSGKSTLMKIAAGLADYDEGRIIRPKGTRVVYLPQSGIVHRGSSLLDEAETAYDELRALADESKEITVSLERSEGNQKALLERYQEIHDTLELAEWDRRDARIEQILVGLGFSRDEFQSAAGTFSGGWQMRIALAKVLLRSPDVLLLDEPTNYLDLEATEWLQDFLKRYNGGVLLVSHDRGFLDETCTQVAELLMNRLKVFRGNYSAFEKAREGEMEELVERWKRQQEEIGRIEAFISKFRYKATKASQVQSRIKMLEKIERIEIPPALKRIHFSFPPSPHSGKTVLKVENLERRYGDKLVFDSMDLELQRHSRTAVVGINGAGKTTLLRIISGEDTGYSGSMQFGTGVKVGYFSQDQESALDPNLSVIQEAAKGSDEGESRLRSLLGAFLFSGDDIEKKVNVLSGGERNRLALMKILLEPVNLLILDEPTNHLDIHSKDILLEALEGFGGTLVIVSHDRYFLGKIANQVLEIANGKGTIFQGDYAYYRWRRERSESQEDDRSAEIKSVRARSGESTDNRSGSPTAREDQKKRRAAIARLRREEEALTSRLEAKENEAAVVRAALEIPENYSDPDKAYELSAQLMEIEERLEQISSAWEEAALKLEQAEIETSVTSS